MNRPRAVEREAYNAYFRAYRKENLEKLRAYMRKYSKEWRVRHHNIKRCELSGRDYTREIVRVRDNYTCQKCGKKWVKGTRRFDVHHLGGECGEKTKKYDRITDLAGLTTLCHKDHLNLPEVREKMIMGNNPVENP